MKKIFLPLLYLIILSGINSCSHDDDSTSDGVIDYIQFKVDGQLVRIENCAADVQNLGLGWHPSGLEYHTDDSTYTLGALVAKCKASVPSASVVISHIPLEVEDYIDMGGFSYDVSSNKRYSAHTSMSGVNGNINFTQVERNLGGTVKGTFNFSNVTLYDGSTSTDGHIITEGEFQVVIGQ